MGRLQAQELLLTSVGVKPGGRTRVLRSELGHFASVARRHNLNFTVGWNAVEVADTPGRPGYGEWAQWQPAVADADQQFYVYFARDPLVPQELRTADEEGDDCKLGSMLGYPPCCVRHFQELRGLSRGDDDDAIDPVLASLDDDRPIAWPVNVSLISQDRTLLSHVPCSAECKPSLDLAMRYLDVLFQTERATASELARTLVGHVIYSRYLGVVRFTAYQKLGGLQVVSVDEGDTALHRELKRSRHVQRARVHLHVGDLTLGAGQCRLFEFT